MKPIENKPKPIPYGRQCIDSADVAAVTEALLSDWLTTGPRVEAFEEKTAKTAGVRCGGAVSSGTAALHAAMHAIGIGPGDEVIVPPMTFAATANAVVYQGGTPVFADVQPDTLLLDPETVEARISSKTRAIVAVDYAGQMCDYDRLQQIAQRHGLYLVADACHSIGGQYKGRLSGSCADLSVFSFHPVKHVTTGEGGMVVSDNPDLIARVKQFRNHGITTDLHEREAAGSWYYEIADIGYNYRLTDFQCALGIAQLEKLAASIEKRNAIARCYDEFFSQVPQISALHTQPYNHHAYHLYVIQLHLETGSRTRQQVFSFLRNENIGVNVHYIPVHCHPFYQKKFHTFKGLCPSAEAAYERILTLPIFPSMDKTDMDRVCQAVQAAVQN